MSKEIREGRREAAITKADSEKIRSGRGREDKDAIDRNWELAFGKKDKYQ